MGISRRKGTGNGGMFSGKRLGTGGISKWAPSVPPAPAFLTTKCIEFNDALGVTNEYISVADHASLDFALTMTWSGWVKNTTATFGSLMTKGDYGANTRAYCVFQDYASAGTSKCSFLVSSNGTVHKVLSTSAVVFDNTWKHMVWTFSSGTVKAYVNGTEDASLVTTTAGTVNSLNNSANSIRFGQYFNTVPTLPWGGRMCEVSLWNVALDQTQVTALYNSGKPGDVALHSQYANCAAWWRLGEGDSVTSAGGVLDSKSTNHGTGTNMEAGDIKTDAP